MSDDLDKPKDIKTPMRIWRKAFETVKTTEPDKGITGMFLGVVDTYTCAKKRSGTIRLTKLFESWCMRDTWLICEEAVSLSVGIAPRDMMLVEYMSSNPWELARNCGGYSLSVTNLKCA